MITVDLTLVIISREDRTPWEPTPESRKPCRGGAGIEGGKRERGQTQRVNTLFIEYRKQ